MRPLILPGRPKPYVMAHRGDRAHYPENTLIAFRRAFELGADILETDLHLTADGFFVCIHDSTLDRTTGGSGPVSSFTLAGLKTFSAARGFPAYESERIPTLSEAAALVPSDAALSLELKDDAFLRPSVVQNLVAELQSAAVYERTIILSFSPARLESMRRIAPDLPLGLITLRGLLPDPRFTLIGPFWPILLLNPFYTAIAHVRGQVVAPLDPSPASRLWLYRLLRCDAILADDPGHILRLLGR